VEGVGHEGVGVGDVAWKGGGIKKEAGRAARDRRYL